MIILLLLVLLLVYEFGHVAAIPVLWRRSVATQYCYIVLANPKP